MKKKILITERQLDRLVSFIIEADNPNNVQSNNAENSIDNGPSDGANDDVDNEKKKKEEEEKNKKILEEIKGEFNRGLNGAKPCDDITIWFGDVDEEDKWIFEKLSILILRVLSIGTDGMSVKSINVEGNLPLKKNEIYMIKFNDCFNIENSGAYLRFYLLGNELKPEEDPNIIKTFNIRKFLSFEVISNKNNCKKPIVNVNDISIKQAKLYKGQVDKILKSMEYTPGLFGMNNIFFFPKGFSAMDDILSKYGLSVDKHHHYYNDDEVVFKIIGEIKDENFKKNTNIKGIINFENNIIVDEWLFEVPKGQKILKGEIFNVNVYELILKTKEFKYKTKIEILDTKRKNDNDNYNDNEIKQINNPTNTTDSAKQTKTDSLNTNITSKNTNTNNEKSEPNQTSTKSASNGTGNIA